MALAMKSSLSGLRATRAAPVRASRLQVVVRAQQAGKPFDRNWLNTDPLVFMLGFAGWTIPSTIGVPAFGGKSLFGLLTESIGTELAHFPTGPAISDSFWLYLLTWHIGLFTTMLLGQVGVQGRKQGYW